MKKEEVEQPSFDLQAVIDSIMEATPEKVVVNGKERIIGWLHNGTMRKFSHIMLKEKDPWKRSVKVCACVLLNHRYGLVTWLLLHLWHPVYWRWLYYVVDIDQVDVVGVLDASKKKIQSEPLALATILATAVMDTMMTMSRQEYGRAALAGEPPTR